MDFTPDIHLIASMQNARLGWHDALAELIDNSLDAGAMQIALEFGNKELRISDDGEGSSDIASMIRFGSHRRHSTTNLGRYGIGLKDAWLWSADCISIETSTATQRSSIEVSLSDLGQPDGSRWVGPDPVTVEVAGKPGTTIRFSRLKRNKPAKDVFQRLGLTFMPALQSGRQIVLKEPRKRKPIQPYKIPPLIDRVTDSFSIDGRTVDIDIGIVKDGARIDYPGFLICYGHRVIEHSAIGTGQYSAARMSGTIILGSAWGLTKNKNAMSDSRVDELERQIYDRIKLLLQKADCLSEDIESKHLKDELEAAINDTIRNARKRERRDQPAQSEPGTIIPKSTGRKRRSAEKSRELDGSVEEGTPRRKRGYRLDWCNIDPDLIGQVDQLAKVVRLNLDNGFISKVKHDRNTEALYTVAMGLLVHNHCITDGSQPFLFESRDFIFNWGKLMASLSFPEPERMNDAV